MSDSAPSTQSNWEHQFNALLPVFGHRNWVIVADSAYPAQSKPGIETIVARAGQLEVVHKVLYAIASSKHVRANVYLDRELEFVSDADAPGASQYRQQLAAILPAENTIKILHEQVIHKLDAAAEIFRILIVKTEMKIPYTTVFFELDCGYWSAEAEQRLRQAMPAA
jgi:hypothetical protein